MLLYVCERATIRVIEFDRNDGFLEGGFEIVVLRGGENRKEKKNGGGGGVKRKRQGKKLLGNLEEREKSGWKK